MSTANPTAPAKAPAEQTSSASGLAKLPEDPGHTYMFVDLSETYDEKLLTRFYKDLMIPNFPIQDELDPLEKWVELLSPFGTAREVSAESPPDFHVLLLLKQLEGARNFDDASIMGGVVFEYYVSSNTGLLTYLLVSSKYRSLGLGRVLTDRCRESLEKNAKSRGHLAGCNAIFLETNSASKVQESEDVMSPAKRHQIFFKMGLRLVDFDYVQAPLFRGKKKVNFLLLCVFLTARIPKVDDKSHEDSYYLPSALLKNTIHAFWSHSSRITQYRYQDDVDFKRMMDQLSRREKISLLDLPWERPFTIVDLRVYFDLELLVSFYQDMLSPCFKGRQDELDSLDTWITMLTPSQKKGLKNDPIRDDSTESLHVLLALKYSEDEEENAKPMIAGGLAFEYYPSNNCGLLTYLITPMGDRGGRMARALIEQALEVLDLDARFRGQLGGCNVVFMETSEQSLGQLQQQTQLELIDMTQQHATLEKMGWKMLDFEYIQPPFTDTTKKRAMNLMVFMTPRIPKLSQEDSEYLFLPRSTVKNFIKDVWEVNCNRLQYDYTRDTLYKRMMMQLERREKIPLLNRSEGKPWTLVDLREDYDLELMKRFFKELIEPTLKDATDGEPLTMESWLARFAPENLQKKTSGEDHHALVALRSGQTEFPVLLGGLTFKYFTLTNCGLMIRALVKNVEKREEVTKALVERAVDVLDQNAVSRGHLVGCNAIFLEIRETVQAPKTADGSEFDMDISRQHLLLERMGWRLLDFNYVAPPTTRLRDTPRLSLTVFLTPRIPRVPYAQEGYEYHYLPKLTVRNFMEHYWRESGRVPFEQDPEYVRMMDLIERRDRIPLLELPWQRPWTLVDLWEDFDVELLYKFYNNFLVVAHPDKGDREPLSDWLKYLSPQARDNPEVEDFHILLALNYPRQPSNLTMKPNILGGLVFKFSSSTNCGLITFLSVAPQYGVVMAKALVEEATEILVENAMSRGHIAGCNAIFMEVPGFARAPADEKNITFIDHDVLYGMGWKMLNFLYVQPPGSIHGQGRQCLLLALNTSNIPKEQADNKAPVAYIPRDLVQSFVRGRWTSAYSRIGKLLSRDRLYKQTLQGLERLERVVLQDPPWTLPPLPLPPTEPISANDSAARVARL